MNKEQCLDLLMLLSALESWSFANNHKMPDYLCEVMSAACDALRKEILR